LAPLLEEIVFYITTACIELVSVSVKARALKNLKIQMLNQVQHKWEGKTILNKPGDLPNSYK